MPNPPALPAPISAAVITVPAAAARLTARQHIFCRRLIAGASGAEAARQAGYSIAGAARQASRMLRNPAIAAEIERLRGDSTTRARAELDRLLSKVERVFAKALADNQCGAALRAIELEAMLRSRGARSLPEDVSPVDVENDPTDGDERDASEGNSK
jgi:phage terminase small subunit